MSYIKHHIRKIGLTINDIILIVLMATPFIFISMRTALFVAAIGSSILLMRRTILFLSPGYFDDGRILHDDKEFHVPKGVEIFELNNSETIGTVYKYIGVLRSMGLKPRILIIRFNRISQINSFDIFLLDEVINRLSERGITIYLSDVNLNIRNLLNKYNLFHKIGKNEMFYKIENALQCAETALNLECYIRRYNKSELQKIAKMN